MYTDWIDFIIIYRQSQKRVKVSREGTTAIAAAGEQQILNDRQVNADMCLTVS